ncbi:Calycin-like protein [Pseudocohnilembus persalinus]|uniref:Calycin-like protein n=1 Tax=Pseudocohnilembus persalinus TaxID=266149 RepID=A0A0V0QEF0_PSEPJ|nr:Calycin-like protein [Pseudocohnilembus persalinus]|eukprot:KRX00507.1 Calycin-like protein [Pseudocohnilembus persalinus]
MQQQFFLQGEWQGKGAVVDSDKKIEYQENIQVNHIKGPVYMYIQKTKKVPEQTPLHSETGYFRVFPSQEGSSEGSVELLTAQPFGVASIEIGKFSDKKITLSCKQDKLIRTETAKKPFVTEFSREFWINDKGNLEYKMNLGTENYQARHHLSAELQKI